MGLFCMLDSDSQCGHLGVRKLLLERLLERDMEVDVLNDEVLVNTLAVVLGKRY